jgi:hypothetical protein
MNVMSRMHEPPEKSAIVEGARLSAFDRMRRR